VEDYLTFIKNKDNEKTLFDTIPYLGIFYLPLEIKDGIKFFQDYEKCDIKTGKGGLKKCKVIDNSSTHHMRFIYYDDHHGHITACEVYKDDYYMEGNILQKLPKM